MVNNQRRKKVSGSVFLWTRLYKFISSDGFSLFGAPEGKI